MFMSAAVGWRPGRAMQSPSPCAQLFQLALLAVAFLGGLPTTIIDAYNTQDITISRMRPRAR
jgi:hypothetical protein